MKLYGETPHALLHEGIASTFNRLARLSTQPPHRCWQPDRGGATLGGFIVRA